MNLTKLREIAKARTQGKWRYEPERYSAKCVIGLHGDDRWIANCLPEWNGEFNGHFIVEMANHIDALLDVVGSVKALVQAHYIDATCKDCTGEVNHVEQLLENLERLEEIE